jgi:hypothetical protein
MAEWFRLRWDAKNYRASGSLVSTRFAELQDLSPAGGIFLRNKVFAAISVFSCNAAITPYMGRAEACVK